MNGLICVNKPKGLSSQQVVTRVKKILNCKKAGHLGTLDPLAQGVLVVALGRATKLFDYFLPKIKTYVARFTFGTETDTLDSAGKVVATSDKKVSQNEVMKVLDDFCGEISQLPPNYSALNINGVKAYKLARSGKEVQLETRKVVVHSFKLLQQIDLDTFEFEIVCGAGTYIRALARDVANALGVVGHMSSLVRTASGSWNIKSSYTLEDVERLKTNCIVSMPDSLSELPTLEVDGKWYKKLVNGNPVLDYKNAPLSKVFCNGEFFGIAQGNGAMLKMEYFLK